ncbi:MAG: isocitrate/isopropylmalate family dehydrogenase [Candidatus Korarchaeota archaeon]|nr:isocitrate/isopropylmalate family dehydrogenase [Candidatus Korarchaeota archaeon]
MPNAVQGFDGTMVRENTEGLYVRAGWTNGETAVDLRVTTRRGSERICRYGYRYAKEIGKERVYVVHKANVLLGCRLFRDVCSSVAKEEGLEFREMYVDAAAMRLAMDRPFDVIITTNMFGDILADLAAAYIGGLGMYPSGNIGDEKAVFEPVHGTAPDIAGKGIANPMATLLSAAMMFRWLGYGGAGEDLEGAVRRACELGYTTPDVGGRMRTWEVCASVKDLISER